MSSLADRDNLISLLSGFKQEETFPVVINSLTFKPDTSLNIACFSNYIFDNSNLVLYINNIDISNFINCYDKCESTKIDKLQMFDLINNLNESPNSKTSNINLIVNDLKSIEPGKLKIKVFNNSILPHNVHIAEYKQWLKYGNALVIVYAKCRDRSGSLCKSPSKITSFIDNIKNNMTVFPKVSIFCIIFLCVMCIICMLFKKFRNNAVNLFIKF